MVVGRSFQCRFDSKILNFVYICICLFAVFGSVIMLLAGLCVIQNQTRGTISQSEDMPILNKMIRITSMEGKKQRSMRIISSCKS